MNILLTCEGCLHQAVQRAKPPRRMNCASRRGGVYVAVLGAAMIVSLAGLLALHVANLDLRRARRRRDFNEASTFARSAVELALLRANAYRQLGSHDTRQLHESFHPFQDEDKWMEYRILQDEQYSHYYVIEAVGGVRDAACVYRVTVNSGGDRDEIVVGSWRRAAAPL